MGELPVKVLRYDMLIVTNASVPMVAVSKSAKKLTGDAAVHVIKDSNPVGRHVLVCDY